MSNQNVTNINTTSAGAEDKLYNLGLLLGKGFAVADITLTASLQEAARLAKAADGTTTVQVVATAGAVAELAALHADELLLKGLGHLQAAIRKAKARQAARLSGGKVIDDNDDGFFAGFNAGKK